MAMMIARPTAASAAAWVMMKMANIWPARSWLEVRYRAKATMSRLTPLSISSMLSKMPIALRRESTPYMPSANKMLPRTRKWRRPGTRNSIRAPATRRARLVLPRDDDRADQGYGEKYGGDLERQDVAGEHQPADRLGGGYVEQAVTDLPWLAYDHDDRDHADRERDQKCADPLAASHQARGVHLIRGHEDGEDDQHHDRADVDNELGHGQEVGPEQRVHHGHAAQHGGQRQRGADQILDR